MTTHAGGNVINLEHGRRHFGARMVLVVSFIALGSASYGFSNAVIGSTLGQASFLTAMGLDTASNAQALISAVLAIFYVGGFFGAFGHALLADRYGRKVSASVACIIMVVGSAVCTAANSMPLYIAFRFFCGWA
jgi:MFS family permease